MAKRKATLNVKFGGYGRKKTTRGMTLTITRSAKLDPNQAVELFVGAQVSLACTYQVEAKTTGRGRKRKDADGQQMMTSEDGEKFTERQYEFLANVFAVTTKAEEFKVTLQIPGVGDDNRDLESLAFREATAVITRVGAAEGEEEAADADGQQVMGEEEESKGRPKIHREAV